MLSILLGLPQGLSCALLFTALGCLMSLPLPVNATIRDLYDPNKMPEPSFTDPWPENLVLYTASPQTLTS